MSKQYSILHAPVLSFFSRDFYDDVARRWKRIAFLYLFLMLALTWAVTTIGWHYKIKTFVHGPAVKFITQIPELAIRNGVAVSQVAQPAILKDPSTGDAWAIFDTTGQYTDLANTSALILLTDKYLYFRTNPHKVERIKLPQVKNLSLSGDIILDLIDVWLPTVMTVFYCVMLPMSLVYRLLLALLLGAIALLLAAAFNRKLSFAGGVRLGVMAMTPMLLIDTLLGLTVIPYALGCVWWIICGLVNLGFLVLAVSSIRNDQADTNIDLPWVQPTQPL